MKKIIMCAAFVAASTSLLAQNALTNALLVQDGGGNINGWEAYASFSGPGAFSSAWGLFDAPVIGNGDGSGTFGMNDQLPQADSFWAGATQEMSFQHNFWSSDNGAGVAPGALNYGDTFTFSGNVVVSEDYAAGNTGTVFVQFLDKNYAGTYQNFLDIASFAGDGGNFSITTAIPADADLNIIQVGFRNSGTVETAGEMTFSNLSVTVVPEPSAYGLIAGLVALACVTRRRR